MCKSCSEASNDSSEASGSNPASNMFTPHASEGWARCHVAAESCQLLGGSPWLLATLRLVFGPWRLVATGLKNKADSGPDDRSKQRREACTKDSSATNNPMLATSAPIATARATKYSGAFDAPLFLNSFSCALELEYLFVG